MCHISDLVVGDATGLIACMDLDCKGKSTERRTCRASTMMVIQVIASHIVSKAAAGWTSLETLLAVLKISTVSTTITMENDKQHGRVTHLDPHLDGIDRCMIRHLDSSLPVNEQLRYFPLAEFMFADDLESNHHHHFEICEKVPEFSASSATFRPRKVQPVGNSRDLEHDVPSTR